MVTGSITDALREHRARIRTDAPEQRTQFERAAAAIPALIDQLGLDDFGGAVLCDAKPRILWRFHRCAAEPGPQVVLKVYGDQPRGEGPLLEAWARNKVPVPGLVHGVRDGCSWLLMRYVPMKRLALESPRVRTWASERLAQLGTRIHAAAPELNPLLRPLATVMSPRWQLEADRLRARGFHVPSHWDDLAAQLYSALPAGPLHGDLAGTNVGALGDDVIVYDASALSGPAAFDAARWAARLARYGARPQEVFERWAGFEPFDDEPRGTELLAVECVLEAGSISQLRGTVAMGAVDELLSTAGRLLP
ncbi:MAG: phosphotransferase [Kineosporiaceae bacterium]|nr:phosphotransferase [Kineosporiaceae bacterium]